MLSIEKHLELHEAIDKIRVVGLTVERRVNPEVRVALNKVLVAGAKALAIYGDKLSQSLRTDAKVKERELLGD